MSQPIIHLLWEMWMWLPHFCMVSPILGGLLSINLSHSRVCHICFWWATFHIFRGELNLILGRLILLDDIVVLNGSKVEQRLLLYCFSRLLIGSVTMRLILVFILWDYTLVRIVIIGTTSGTHERCSLSLMVTVHSYLSVHWFHCLFFGFCRVFWAVSLEFCT